MQDAGLTALGGTVRFGRALPFTQRLCNSKGTETLWVRERRPDRFIIAFPPVIKHQTTSLDHQSDQHCSPEAAPPRVRASQQLITGPDHQEPRRNETDADAGRCRCVGDQLDKRNGREDPQPQVRPLRNDDPARVPVTPKLIDEARQHLRDGVLMLETAQLQAKGATVPESWSKCTIY